jgi:hypothetical protein
MAYVMEADKFGRLAFPTADPPNVELVFPNGSPAPPGPVFRGHGWSMWEVARRESGILTGGYVVQLTTKDLSHRELDEWLSMSMRGRYRRITGHDYLIELFPDATLLSLRFE